MPAPTGILMVSAVNDVVRYEEAMLSHLRSEHAGLLKDIRTSADLSDDSKKALDDALVTFGKSFT